MPIHFSRPNYTELLERFTLFEFPTKMRAVQARRKPQSICKQRESPFGQTMKTEFGLGQKSNFEWFAIWMIHTSDRSCILSRVPSQSVCLNRSPWSYDLFVWSPYYKASKWNSSRIANQTANSVSKLQSIWSPCETYDACQKLKFRIVVHTRICRDLQKEPKSVCVS